MPGIPLVLRFSTSLLLTLFIAVSTAHGAIQQRNFQVTGSSGESGTGIISWDDAVVADGGALSIVNVVALNMTITGGNFSSAQVFTLADCVFLNAQPTPTLDSALTFTCDNGEEGFLSVSSTQSNLLYHSAAVLTWIPGGPVAPVVAPIPALSPGGLLALCAFAALGAVMVGRRSRIR